MEEQNNNPAPTPRQLILSILICAALATAFAVISYTAARTKNGTMDENLHAASAYANLALGDFRANPEHPPLWKYWAALPLRNSGMKIDEVYFKTIPEHFGDQWKWCVQTLYRTPGNDPDAIIMAERGMMLVWGVALCAITMWWSWRISGAIAAVAAGVLICFDPNFIAHSALVTNDVAITLIAVALMFALWKFGQRATWLTGIAIALLCAIGITVKFSGIVFLILIAMVLVIRALLPEPWNFHRKQLARPGSKLLLAFVMLAFIGITTFGWIWMVYRFRFEPTPTADLNLNVQSLIEQTAVQEIKSHHPDREPTNDELTNWKPQLIDRVIVFALQHELLPEAFLVGILHVHGGSLLHPGYLLGEIRQTGWWYYFPVAMIFKTATLSLLAIVCVILFALSNRKRWTDGWEKRWLAVCLIAPLVVYGLSAMTSNLNLGVRHVLVLYPFMYIAIAAMVAHLWKRFPQYRFVPLLLAAGLMLDTARAFPNYIAFFNLLGGGTRGGLEILGDSNLDWGQDLKSLGAWYKDWQPRNPSQRLYLRYFGTADPAYYGIEYINMPGGYSFGPAPLQPDRPGVMAISASHLQAILTPKELMKMYQPLRHAKPMGMIGGSIYLFPYPLPQSDLGDDNSAAAPKP